MKFDVFFFTSVHNVSSKSTQKINLNTVLFKGLELDQDCVITMNLKGLSLHNAGLVLQAFNTLSRALSVEQGRFSSLSKLLLFFSSIDDVINAIIVLFLLFFYHYY